jgi:hypothetical protein
MCSFTDSLINEINYKCSGTEAAQGCVVTPKRRSVQGEIHRRMPDKVLLICHWLQCRRVLSKVK